MSDHHRCSTTSGCADMTKRGGPLLRTHLAPRFRAWHVPERPLTCTSASSTARPPQVRHKGLHKSRCWCRSEACSTFGAEMMLPVWLRLMGVLGTGRFNFKVVR